MSGVTGIEALFDHARLLAGGDGGPRYELIAAAFEEAIASQKLREGERLPTVRQLSAMLGVSGATVSAAYDLLNQRGWVRGEVGRGTFVLGPPQESLGDAAVRSGWVKGGRGGLPRTSPWRRRALHKSALYLRAAYPNAIDCTTGRPDPALLPLPVLQRAFRETIEATTGEDLQYGGPEPVAPLVSALMPLLERDGILGRDSDIVVGSSAQQLMVLALAVIADLVGRRELVVAVEDPGYHTAFDAFERAGHRLVGVAMDRQGAIPESLAEALASGANAVLLTPRAHNPMGASWSARRRADLADVLAGYPDVFAIEDDQLGGVAEGRGGSLLSDRRIDDRVIYIRSFAKSIAPDLRLAAVATGPRLRSLLLEAKSFSDGWSSRLTQRALALALADEEMATALGTAAETYAARRKTVLDALAGPLTLAGGTAYGDDGLNVWIHLPPEADAVDVIEQAAQLGVLLAPGEPFFLRPGRSDVLRLSIGGVSVQQCAAIGSAVATAAMTTSSLTSSAASV